MPKVTKLNCTACGAPISVPEGLDFLNCQSCGSFLAIERGEGYVALKVAEKLARAIEDSGKTTQEAIREGTTITRSELQRLQLSQELNGLKSQLANIQAEIRSLSRSNVTRVTAAQIGSLHGNAYHILEQIRQVNHQLFKLKDNDLPAMTRFIEDDIGWINLEIQAVQQSSLGNKQQILTHLYGETNRQKQQIESFKLNQIKAKLSSFAIKITPSDRLGVAELLNKIDADQRYLLSQDRTPEVRALYQELYNRRKEVEGVWQRMEQEYVNSLLATTGYSRTDDSLTGLNAYLAVLDQDIQMLGKQPRNEIVQTSLSKLIAERKRVEKQIHRIDTKARKSAARQASSQGKRNGFFASIAAWFAALGIGLVALFSRSPTTSAAVPASVEMDSTSMAAPIAPSGVRTGSPGGFKTTGVGCLLAFLTLFGFALVGLVSSSIFSGLFNNTDVEAPAFLIILTIGFLMAFRVFARKVMPGITVHTLPRLLEIRIAPDKEPNANTNPRTVRLVLALFVWLFTWLLGFTIFSIFYIFILTDVGAAVFSIFLLAGIILPLIVFFNASVTFSTQQAQA